MAKQHDPEPGADDSPEYLAKWAGQLTEALPPDELRTLVREYGRLSRDGSHSAADRSFARKRAKAIRVALKRKP